MAMNMMKLIGMWTFIVSMLIAVGVELLAYFDVMQTGAWVSVVLIVSGILIGLMNVAQKEAVIVMTAALVIGASAGILAMLPMFGALLEGILANIAMVALPIGMVVGIVSLIKNAMK